MISLEKAYQKITSEFPNKYVYRVNEFEEFYDFVMLNNGEKMTSDFFWPFFTAIFKADGRREDIDWMDDEKYNWIRSYDESEIKEMMKRAS